MRGIHSIELGIVVDTLALAKGIEARNQPSARFRALQRRNSRPLNAQQNIRILDHRSPRVEGCACRFKVRITDRRQRARPFFNCNGRAQRNEFLHRFGRGRDATFAVGGFLQDGNFHQVMT
jgi:hypothetical protein